MVEIVLNSGTEWEVPLNFDPDNNSIQCWGAGGGGYSASGKGTVKLPGGAGGAYARGDNIPLTPGSTIPIRIGLGGSGADGAGDDGGDTVFNETSLSNAVSAGEGVCVAAQRGRGGGTVLTNTGGTPGLASASVGNHTKTSGTAGGNQGTGANDGLGGGSPNGGANVAAPTSTGSPGNPGNAPGGGGSGARGSGTQPGGDGANGRIVINYEPVEPVSGQHRMFLVFSHAAAWLLSGWAGILNILTQKEQTA